jgi:nitrous oxidase accessory protein NosD
VLEINKPIRLLGEKIDETIVNLDPPLVNYTLIYLTMQVHDTAITIDANDVKLAGFTINMPTDRIMSLGGINARGDKIEIVSNKLGRECSIKLNGKLANISGNSISAGVDVIGDNQTISNNLLEGDLDAQGTFSRVTGNTMGDINLRNSSYNLFLNNSFTRMIMEYCDTNFIANNSFESLAVGYYDHGCFNNTVANNKVTGPEGWSILMSKGAYNVFHDNLISNFTRANQYGISIGAYYAVAENNVFYRNMLINNELHVGANWEVEGAGNIWDNGQVGNYWDDYTGKDINGDGIGDVPYIVEGRKGDGQGALVSFVFGQDNYPLMTPFNIDDVSIDFPEWASSESEVSPEPNEDGHLSMSFVVVAALVIAAVVALGVLVFWKKRKRAAV